MARLVPACVWWATADVVKALDGRFGPPVDAYVNGSQVWLRDSGPGDVTVEWRLHPVAGYRRPGGVGTYELFESVVDALVHGSPLAAPLDRLWEGLEAFPDYGDEVEPAPLAAACTEELGLAPDAAGLVDHVGIADRWEATQGQVSIVAELISQLQADA